MVALLHHALDASAARSPGAPAFRFLKSTLSYRALVERSDRLAGLLAASGVGRGDRVGLYLNKSLETPIALYGAMKAGAAYVPLDPGAPPARTRAVMAQCDVAALITHAPKAADAAAALDGYDGPGLRLVLGATGAAPPGAAAAAWEDAETAAPPAPSAPVLEDDLAYIIFTSGSTGAPKGIMHAHRSGLAYAQAAAALYQVAPGDRLSNHAPLHFDMSTFDYLSGPLAGACTVIIPEGYAKLPASLSKLIETERLTHWYSAPFALVQLAERGILESRDLSALRWVMFGGEPFPPKHLRALMARWPQARFANVYGPAEVNQCTHHEVAAADVADDVPPPIGRVWPDAEGLVLDADDRPVRPGETGALAIRSATMMRGYWGRPDLNARAYFERPVSGGVADRFYRTGDLVRDEGDGVLRFLGRADRQVKVRGFRVELDEIEAALAAHEAVAEAAAVLVEDAFGGAAVRGAVTLKPNAAADPDTLRAWAGARLPHYATPDHIDILNDFPRTTSEKVDRRALARRYAPAPEAAGEQSKELSDEV